MKRRLSLLNRFIVFSHKYKIIIILPREFIFENKNVFKIICTYTQICINTTFSFQCILNTCFSISTNTTTSVRLSMTSYYSNTLGIHLLIHIIHL